MILKNLRLTNFGVFSGEHTFDLEPKPSKPIVLFGGKNGTGKSSLFEAIRLCLYGARANRLASRNEYIDYLNSRIHSNSSLVIQPGFAEVAMEFGYTDLGEVRSYEISRSWSRHNGHRTPESLTLRCDGKPMNEVSEEHWQDFVQDLIPSGISELFFFDGEKIQELADDQSDNHALDHSVRSLLGLNLVDRLQADLNIYLSKVSKSTKDLDLKNRLEKLEQDRSTTIAEVQTAEERHAESLGQIRAIQRSIETLEKQIASEGGAFAKNRGKMEKRKADVEASIDRHENDVREQAEGLLAFALIPNLCDGLKAQLEAEEKAHRLRDSQSMVSDLRSALADKIKDETVFENVKSLSDEAKKVIQSEFLRVTAETLRIPLPATPIVHELSAPGRARILGWVSEARTQVPPKMRKTGQELERLYRELHKIQKHLRKVPAEETLKPLLEKLNAHNRELREASQAALEFDNQLKEQRQRQSTLERVYSKELEKLAAAATMTSTIQLVPRIHGVLNQYRKELIEKKIGDLQSAATECFNCLSRKKDHLRRVRINPANFEVVLLDSKNRELKKDQLSAGEKQIYAISMLWALARTSGRPLPMIVDTPLARLDSDHRKLLVQEYFPRASHQMIILSTDTEVEEKYFTELQPHIAHAYHLDYDELEKHSNVTPGYFLGGLNEADKN